MEKSVDFSAWHIYVITYINFELHMNRQQMNQDAEEISRKPPSLTYLDHEIRISHGMPLRFSRTWLVHGCKIPMFVR